MKISKIFTIIAMIAIIILIAILGYGYYKKWTEETKNPIVTMEVEGYGTIKLELYPDIAPETVSNFVALANNKFYDGTVFHRVVKDFMIQGGGFVLPRESQDEVKEDEEELEPKEPLLSDLGIELKEVQKDAEYCIKGEFLANKYNNTLKHVEGVISMARPDYTQYSPTLTEESYNSASAQFFIMTKDSNWLDGGYAAFGKVIEGIDIVHKIEQVSVKPANQEGAEASEPEENIIIKSITVETFGIDYGKPETLEPWSYYNWLYETYGLDLSM